MGSEKREKTSREKIAEIREILADVCVYEDDEIKEEIDHIELCQIYEDLTELNKRLAKIIELVKEEPTAAGDGSEISDEEAIEYLKILEKRMLDISGSAWLGDIPTGVIEVGINAIKNLQTFREKDEPGQVRYEGDGYADGNMTTDYAYCPECDHEIEADSENWDCDFCPNCGKRLRWEE
jgi:hypothetical protein